MEQSANIEILLRPVYEKQYDKGECMKDIIIVCAGATGIEIRTILNMINDEEQKNGNQAKYNLLGFIDDDVTRPLPDFVKEPILGTIRDWQPMGHEVYALGNANPKAKKGIVESLKSRGCVFETIIAPYARVKPDVKIGEGCAIWSYSINSGAVIGDFVNVQGAMIGGHSVIGDYSTVLGFANVQAKLGEGVYVGSHAVVLDVPVGDYATICVGSIVVSKVKAGTKVFGNPAKRVDW